MSFINSCPETLCVESWESEWHRKGVQTYDFFVLCHSAARRFSARMAYHLRDRPENAIHKSLLQRSLSRTRGFAVESSSPNPRVSLRKNAIAKSTQHLAHHCRSARPFAFPATGSSRTSTVAFHPERLRDDPATNDQSGYASPVPSSTSPKSSSGSSLDQFLAAVDTPP